MLLGYTLIATDTRSWVLEEYFSQLDSDDNTCDKYKCIYDIDFVPKVFKLPKTKKDFYWSIDGYLLVSERVKLFCRSNKYAGLKFIKIPGTDYYWLKTSNVLKYDIKKRGTLFLNYNKKCKEYEEIVGADPVCLVDNTLLGDNFYRTDISFGHMTKSPVECVGIKTKNKIKMAGFTGIYFDEIHDHYKVIPKMK